MNYQYGTTPTPIRCTLTPTIGITNDDFALIKRHGNMRLPTHSMCHTFIIDAIDTALQRIRDETPS